MLHDTFYSDIDTRQSVHLMDRCCRYALMRELSDGTCRPCTTSEAAALEGSEPPTRSPSVNPVKPLRTPVRPALSPLGRPSVAAVPGSLEQPLMAAAHLQSTDTPPKEAAGACASAPAQQESCVLDEATRPSQQSAQPCGNSGKENCASHLASLSQCMPSMTFQIVMS